MKELQKSFWDLLTIMATNIVAIPLMILSESIQARFLGPANYGKVALILSAISLLNLVALNWLRLSIIRFGKEEFIKENHLRETTTNFFIATFVSFITISYLFYLFKDSIFNFFEIKNEYAFWVIVIGLFLSVFKFFVLEVLKVIRLIKVYSFMFRLVPKIFILCGILIGVFLLLELNVNIIIAIYLTSDLFIILISLWFIKLKYLFPLKFNRNLLKKMLIFSFPLLFSSWSGYVVTWVDTYVIKYFMTLESVGIYQVSYKIFTTFNSFFRTGLASLLTPIIMVFKTNNEIEKIRVYIKKVIPQISFIMMLIVSAVILITDFAFNLIYGKKFHDSALPFKILVASQNFGIIGSMLSGIITSFDMTKTMFYLGLFTGIFNIVFDIFLVPRLGINGAALTSFFVFSISPIIWLFIINKKFNIKRQLALLFPIITTLITIINILPLSFVIKIVVSLLCLLFSFFLSRRFKLFQAEDVQLLKNVNMPENIRQWISKTILFLSTR